MRKSFRATSVALTCAAAISAGGGLATAAQSPATVGMLCSTTSTIDVTGLAFQPPAVAPGQSSTATATVVNCTNQTQQATEQWLGRFVSSTSSGVPTGCPVLDPIAFSLSLAPQAQSSSSVGYLVPSTCTATGLVVTVEILQQGKVVSQRSAQLSIVQPTP